MSRRKWVGSQAILPDFLKYSEALPVVKTLLCFELTSLLHRFHLFDQSTKNNNTQETKTAWINFSSLLVLVERVCMCGWLIGKMENKEFLGTKEREVRKRVETKEKRIHRDDVCYTQGKVRIEEHRDGMDRNGLGLATYNRHSSCGKT